MYKYVVNQCFVDLGETPITKRKLRSKKYSERKLELLMTKFMTGEQHGECEILQQLKERFHSISQNSVIVQILTILPKSWSIRRIQTEFGTSNFLAKQLVKDKGVLSSPA